MSQRYPKATWIGLPILAVTVVFVSVIMLLPPSLQQQAPVDPYLRVAVTSLRMAPIRIEIASYGRIQPRTSSALVASVGGEITEVSPNFRAGSFFVKGERLLLIDPRDYEIAVTIAEAELASAEQALTTERAQSEQARVDWERLGGVGGGASELVLRKPQLASAQAILKSAQANLRRAQLDLERTRVTAPYDGRVLSKHVDLGQVVAENAELADIYAIDYVEVRLPIRNSDLPFLELPEVWDTDHVVTQNLPRVVLTSQLSGERWEGRVVRTESAIDEPSRQLHVVAQIKAPFSYRSDRRPLKIGEYVTARIKGRRLPAAISIPTASLYENSYVYVLTDGVLQRRPIEILWQDEKIALVGSGLRSGEYLVTSPLGRVSSGTPATAVGAKQRGNARAPASASPEG